METIYSLRNAITKTLTEMRALITAGTVIPSQKYRIATGSSIGVMIVTGLTSNTLEQIAIREDTKDKYVYTIGTTGADSGVLTTNPTGANTGDETLTSLKTKASITGDFVGTNNTQALDNKTLLWNSGDTPLLQSDTYFINIANTANKTYQIEDNNPTIETLRLTSNSNTQTLTNKTISGLDNALTNLKVENINFNTADDVADLTNNDYIIVNQNGTSKKITANQLKGYISMRANDCSVQGEYGFGVSPCDPKKKPSWLMEMEGTWNKYSPQRGNYIDIYGGEWCWNPRTWVRITNNTASPYNGTKVEIVPYYTYKSEADANADGFFVHRAFINAGKIIDGFFKAKYAPSLVGYVDGTAGMACPKKNGNPISSSSTTKRNSTNPTYPGSYSNFKSNSQSPTDNYQGGIEAAKSMGTGVHATTIFQQSYLALVGLAQAQAATVANCAFLDVAPPCPKGNNKSGVLGDINDTLVTYTNPTDGYWNGRLEAAQNGSGTPFAKTTHNGCPNGIADINGNQLKTLFGLTCIASSVSITGITIATEAVFTTGSAHGYSTGQRILLDGTATPTEWSSQLSANMYTVEVLTTTTFKLKKEGVYVNTSARTVAYTSGITSYYGVFYMYKESVDVTTVTSAQHFDTTWIQANCDIVTPNFVDGSCSQYFGNGTNQVFSGSVDRTSNDYKLSACGLPMANGFSTSGTTSMGNDLYYQYYRHLLCVLGDGYWAHTTSAGARYRSLYNLGSNSSTIVTFDSSLIE